MLFPYKRNGLWGYCDRDGEIQIPAIYEYAGEFCEGLAQVCVNELTGFIDGRGKLVIKPQFVSAGSYSEGLSHCSIEKDGVEHWGYIDKSGIWAISPEYKRVSPFSEGRASVSKCDDIFAEQLVIDSAGRQIVTDGAIRSHFHEGMAVATTRDEARRIGYIDLNGKWVIPPVYWSAGSFHDGLAGTARENEKYEFIDKNGRTAIPPRWMAARNFSEGLCAVDEGQGDGWQFIDKTGTYAFKALGIYETSNFCNGLAHIWMNDEGDSYFIDKSGNIAIPHNPDIEFSNFNNGLCMIWFDSDNTGYMDCAGKLIFRP